MPRSGDTAPRRSRAHRCCAHKVQLPSNGQGAVLPAHSQHALGTLLLCKERLADARLRTHQDQCCLLCPLHVQKHRPSPRPSLASTARFPAAWHRQGLPAPLPAPQRSQSSSGPGAAYREDVGAPLGLLADGGGCVGGSDGLDPQLPLADAGGGGHRGGVVAEGSSAVGGLGQNEAVMLSTRLWHVGTLRPMHCTWHPGGCGELLPFSAFVFPLEEQ